MTTAPKRLCQPPGQRHVPEPATLRRRWALTQRDIDWFFSHFLNRQEELYEPSVSPRASDLSMLPPAVIIAAGVDPLRDDANRYAQRFRAAGTEVKIRVSAGAFHGFWIAPGVLAEAREASPLRLTRSEREPGGSRYPSGSSIAREVTGLGQMGNRGPAVTSFPALCAFVQREPRAAGRRSPQQGATR